MHAGDFRKTNARNDATDRGGGVQEVPTLTVNMITDNVWSCTAENARTHTSVSTHTSTFVFTVTTHTHTHLEGESNSHCTLTKGPFD